MTSENDNEISLDSLFAAVGATGNADARASRSNGSEARDASAEDDLLRALGIVVPKADPASDVEPEPESDYEPTPEPDLAFDSEPEPLSEMQPGPEPEAADEPEPEPEPEASDEPDPESDPEPEPEPETEPDPDPAFDSEPEPLSEMQPEPEPEPETEPEPDFASEIETEPEPGSDSEHPEPVRVPIPQPLRSDVQPVVPYVAAGESAAHRSQVERKEARGLKVVSLILAVLAVVCVVAAGCLFMGLNPLAPDGPDSGHESSPTQSAGVQMTGDPITMTYSYVVMNADNEPCDVVETARFGEDGLLESSRLEISVASKEEAEEILAVLGKEFGVSMTESVAADDKATCTIALPENGYDPDSYTKLLEEKMTNFKVVSEGGDGSASGEAVGLDDNETPLSSGATGSLQSSDEPRSATASSAAMVGALVGMAALLAILAFMVTRVVKEKDSRR